MRRRVILASKNRGKLLEVRSILSDLEVEVVGLEEFPEIPEVVEDRESFLENARKKSEVISKLTGELVIADDSGLEVDALGGRPGVRSARYARDGASDEENNLKLLQEMRGIPLADRKARFRCVMVLSSPDGRWWATEGIWEGTIAEEPRGSGGFGYDPVFFLPELGKTVAELTSEEKNSMSHRAKALESMKKLLKALLSEEKREA